MASNLSSQKTRDYQKYKQFQKRFEHLLQKAEDPQQLENMPIDKLLDAYSKVEQMYEMRTQFRSRYFTPENWDSGHQTFIAYLVGVMNIYADELKRKFDMSINSRIQNQNTQSSFEQEASLPLQSNSNSNSNLNQQISQIKNRILEREKEETEIWNSVIPDLIRERQMSLAKRKNILVLLQRLFSGLVPNITEAQTIDVVRYFMNVMDIMSEEKLDKTGYKYSRTKPYPWLIYAYPKTFDEFILNDPVFDRIDLALSVLKFFYSFNSKPELLYELIVTVLDVTSVSTVHSIVITPYKNFVVFVPNLEEGKSIFLRTKGKTVFGIQQGSAEVHMIHILDAIPFAQLNTRARR